MPIGGFLPESESLGRKLLPDDTNSIIPQLLQRIQSGQSHFDPGASRFSPVPVETMMSPEMRAQQSAPGPGSIGGGVESSLPFSAQQGLSAGGVGAPPTPTGPMGGGTSSVVGNMMGSRSGGMAAPEMGSASVSEGNLGNLQSEPVGPSGGYRSATGQPRQVSQRTRDMIRQALAEAMGLAQPGQFEALGGGQGGYSGGDTAGHTAQEIGGYEWGR